VDNVAPNPDERVACEDFLRDVEQSDLPPDTKAELHGLITEYLAPPRTATVPTITATATLQAGPAGLSGIAWTDRYATLIARTDASLARLPAGDTVARLRASVRALRGVPPRAAPGGDTRKRRVRGPDNDLQQLEHDLRALFAEFQDTQAEPPKLQAYVEGLKLRGYQRISVRTLQRYREGHGLPLPPYPEPPDA
jgi:hypothetical protein